jgi:hypothetical protein
MFSGVYQLWLLIYLTTYFNLGEISGSHGDEYEDGGSKHLWKVG